MIRVLREFFSHHDEKTRDTNWIFGSMAVGAILGLLASFVLSVEAITLAENPNAALSCSVNLVLNCATVAKDASSTVLGFPNSFIGMMTMPVLLTIAVAGLAGVRFPRWFMRATFIGSIVGVLFASWMFYQSYFVIQSLCPWCLLTDLSMLLIFFAVLRYNVREGHLCIKGSFEKRMQNFTKKNYDKLALAVTVVLIALLILVKYGDALFA